MAWPPKNIVLLSFILHILHHFSILLFYFDEQMASSFSIDRCLHKHFLKDKSIMYALWRANRLENERESNEEPNLTYKYP